MFYEYACQNDMLGEGNLYILKNQKYIREKIGKDFIDALEIFFNLSVFLEIEQ